MYSKLIDLFRNESFEDSVEKFNRCSIMILLINRYRSLSSYVNDSLEKLAVPKQNDNVIILRGLWEPVWYDGKTKADFENVQQYFRRYVSTDPSGALDFIQKEESKIDESMVPYRELREAILRYAYPNVVKDLLLSAPYAIYLGIHDSDIQGLNGLYTHYQDIIIQHGYPDVVSTGYQTFPGNHPQDAIIQKVEMEIQKSSKGKKKRQPSKIIEQLYEKDSSIRQVLEQYRQSGKSFWDAFKCYKKKAKRSYESLSKDIELDMRTREALASVDGRLIYWPEPNMLVKIFDKRCSTNFDGYSFIDSTEEEYEYPHESSVILSYVYAPHKVPRCIFDSRFPILLKLNDDFLSNKKLPQASYQFRNTSITVSRQLKIPSKLVNKFKSIFSNLCGFYSNADFLGVTINSDDEFGNTLVKMVHGINEKFEIESAVDFVQVARKLACITAVGAVVESEQ